MREVRAKLFNVLVDQYVDYMTISEFALGPAGSVVAARVLDAQHCLAPRRRGYERIYETAQQAHQMRGDL